MTVIEMIKEIATAPFDFAEGIVDVAQAASLPALSIGSGAVMATALLDHIGVLAVMNDPALLHRCLEIAAAAAIVRVVAYFRGSGTQTQTATWWPPTGTVGTTVSAYCTRADISSAKSQMDAGSSLTSPRTR